MMSLDTIPEDIREQFSIKDVNIKVSVIEQHVLNDTYEIHEWTKQKMHRDLSGDIGKEIKLFIDQKRNLRFAIMGKTRTGKSLIAIKILDIVFSNLNISFNDNLDKFICGNQQEYRKALKDAEYGDFYIVDENTMSRAGIGANIEMAQMQDFNSIIAKKNVSVIFIHPEKFMNIGAIMGFRTFGRDSKNWLSKVLVYELQGHIQTLVGYAIINVGELFYKHGCYLFKSVGGCTNNNKLSLSDIDSQLIEYSWCIPKEYDKSLIRNDKRVCPFYDVCEHGLCKYEHKKDNWIDKIMEGDIDFRTKERFEISLNIMFDMIQDFDPKKDKFILKASNGKDLKNKIKLRLHKYTNAKLGIAELDELIELIKSNTDIEFLNESLKAINNKELLSKYKTIYPKLID